MGYGFCIIDEMVCSSIIQQLAYSPVTLELSWATLDLRRSSSSYLASAMVGDNWKQSWRLSF